MISADFFGPVPEGLEGLGPRSAATHASLFFFTPPVQFWAHFDVFGTNFGLFNPLSVSLE